MKVWYGDQQFRVSVSKRGTGAGSLYTSIGPTGSSGVHLFSPKKCLPMRPVFVRSTNNEIHFEEACSDIVDRTYLPALREDIDDHRRRLVNRLETAVGGRVTVAREGFFLANGDGDIEFTLLAEGLRKLGLLRAPARWESFTEHVIGSPVSPEGPPGGRCLRGRLEEPT